MTGRRSRNKGAAGEREFLNLLEALNHILSYDPAQPPPNRNRRGNGAADD